MDDDKINKEALAVSIEYIKRDIRDIKDKLDRMYVTRAEFEPVKKLVYGLVSVILVGVIGALMALIIK